VLYSTRFRRQVESSNTLFSLLIPLSCLCCLSGLILLPLCAGLVALEFKLSSGLIVALRSILSSSQVAFGSKGPSLSFELGCCRLLLPLGQLGLSLSL
jgi:hypothetical protein